MREKGRDTSTPRTGDNGQLRHPPEKGGDQVTEGGAMSKRVIFICGVCVCVRGRQ